MRHMEKLWSKLRLKLISLLIEVNNINEDNIRDNDMILIRYNDIMICYD